MSSLLPNNATPQEVALDLATARIGNVDVPIRTLWDPENCPADILPWLAWAFSVDKWDATWTEAQKRAIVAAAIFVHRRKGTPAAVKEVVSAIFGGGDVIEAWQDVDLSAHEFKIVTTGTLQSEAQFLELIDLVDGAKPVRSWLVAVQIQSQVTGLVYIGTATLTGGKTTISGGLSIDPAPLAFFSGTAAMVATRTTIDAQDPSFAVNGFEPEFVASFAKSSPDVKRWNYYRANGVEVDFSKAFDFARAGSATYVDADGVIQTAAAGVPRVGHHVWDGSAWVNQGLLLESEARTNLLVYSEEIDNAAWTKTAVSVSANAIIAPDGTTTADKLIENASTGQHGCGQARTADASTPYAFSFYAKKNERSFVQATIGSQFNGATITAIFNLDTGVSSVVTGTATVFAVEAGNGFFRCSVVATSSASPTASVFRVGPAQDSSTASYTGDGTSGIYIWGAQLEAGSTPSSYIPTAAAAAARAASSVNTDNASYDASAMWGVMKGTEAYADLGTAGQVELLDWRDDVDNRITITLDTDGAETGEITLTMVNGGASASVAVDAMTPGINQALSLAWRVTGSEIAISCNGGAAVSAATAIGIPDLSAASIVLEGMGARALITQGTGDIGDTGIEEASA